MLIREAIYEDIWDIANICEENLLQNKQRSEAGNQGFLVSKISDDYAKNMIDDKNNYIVLIAQENE